MALPGAPPLPRETVESLRNRLAALRQDDVTGFLCRLFADVGADDQDVDSGVVDYRMMENIYA